MHPVALNLLLVNRIRLGQKIADLLAAARSTAAPRLPAASASEPVSDLLIQ